MHTSNKKQKITKASTTFVGLSDVESTRRLFIFYVTSYLGAVILFYFAYKYFNTEYVGLQLLYSIGSAFIIGSVMLAQKFKNKIYFIQFTGFTVGCLMLGQVYTGGFENTGLYWIFPFQFAMFILLGYRWGMIGSIIIFVLSAVLLFNPQYTIAKYSFVESSRFLASLAVIDIFIFTSEFTRYKSHQAMMLLNWEKENQANTDSLTNLPNRRYITSFFLDQVNTKKSSLLPISIIMVDIDHFKKVNDNHGHDAGDRVLIWFANILQQSIRNSDLVARMGGEEFLIVFPKTQIDEAEKITNAIRKKIEKTAFYATEDMSLKITASFGIAMAEHVTEVESAMNKADVNLYLAKRSGRNRACIGPENSPPSMNNV
ncbi:GGDEF domain-containing protein [Glaciecola sp. SC05]|uniref:GGDEF domain-containing protein n=1 Tax=Glaciecola sp. SC05 TaxID=1987355 RepID=UPI0035299A9D